MAKPQNAGAVAFTYIAFSVVFAMGCAVGALFSSLLK